MGAFSKWILHEDQKELFEILYAGTLTIIFLALIALLLWPLGHPVMAFRLAKGFLILWLVLYVTYALLYRAHQFFRVNMYDHFDAFLISNLIASCLLQVGWAAFAAITVHSFAGGAPIWILVILYLVGVLSCIVAFCSVSAFYQGSFYKLVSLPLSLVCFIGFSVWPKGGRAIYWWVY